MQVFTNAGKLWIFWQMVIPIWVLFCVSQRVVKTMDKTLREMAVSESLHVLLDIIVCDLLLLNAHAEIAVVILLR